MNVAKHQDALGYNHVDRRPKMKWMVHLRHRTFQGGTVASKPSRVWRPCERLSNEFTWETHKQRLVNIYRYPVVLLHYPVHVATSRQAYIYQSKNSRGSDSVSQPRFEQLTKSNAPPWKTEETVSMPCQRHRLLFISVPTFKEVHVTHLRMFL